jgi:hypothetical protein
MEIIAAGSKPSRAPTLSYNVTRDLAGDSLPPPAFCSMPTGVASIPIWRTDHQGLPLAGGNANGESRTAILRDDPEKTPNEPAADTLSILKNQTRIAYLYLIFLVHSF